MAAEEKTTSRVRGTTPEIELRARELRHQMTPAESALWSRLRRSQLAGLRFRAQHPLGPSVVDFCCPACRLIVEIDGQVHDDQVEYDQARTEHLAAYGYRLLRFRNEEVLAAVDRVLEQVLAAAFAPGISIQAVDLAQTSPDCNRRRIDTESAS